MRQDRFYRVGNRVFDRVYPGAYAIISDLAAPQVAYRLNAGVESPEQYDWEFEDAPTEKPDAINPQHYQGFSNGAEAIDICEHLDFLCGNIVKYAARLGKKPGNSPLQEAQKIQWYANRLVEKYERLND